MNALEIKENIDSLFPCKWQGDFVDDLNDLFSRFIEIVKISNSLNQESLSFIEELCNTIIEIIQYYYEGRRWLAFEKFTIVMNGKEESDGLFDRLGKIIIMKDDYLYRGRPKENDKVYDRLDMLHIPLDKRGLVKTQRFSCPGFPCLYLGNSIYCCWEELKRKPLESLMFSAFRARRQFSLFDLRIPDLENYQVDKIDQTLKRVPLILACSIAVKCPDDVFKPEYINPQFITDTIILRNKAILKDESIINSDNNIWGVIYSSTQIHEGFTNDTKLLQNIMLPIVGINSKKNYCQNLASLFDISKPLSYDHDINQLCGLRDTTRTIGTLNARINTKERYENSIFALIEKDLQKSEFEELEHLYIPEGVIYLDYLGTPVDVPVYASANCQWEIDNEN